MRRGELWKLIQSFAVLLRDRTLLLCFERGLDGRIAGQIMVAVCGTKSHIR